MYDKNTSDELIIKRQGIISPDQNITYTFKPPLEIGILASGEGTNFEAIAKSINNFELDAVIKLLIVNNYNSGAIQKAKKLNIPFKVLDHKNFSTREDFDYALIREFELAQVEGIIMAGWMRIVTNVLIKTYPGRIINLHPSILPSFKGNNAIKQAIDNKSLITGCTTHFVSLELDSGKIIAQAAIPILANDSYNDIREKVRYYEHLILPLSINLAGKEWRNI